MPREIKFRGKRPDNGEWVYGYYYKHLAPLQCVKPKELQEGGQEIYEGDIVRWDSLNINGAAIGEVTFFEGRWFIQGSSSNACLHDCLSITVIGNIHENKELLI